MCIICAKPANTAFPEAETIRNMWTANSDGAGLMFTKDGKVVIRKGFMKLTDFEAELARLREEINLYETPVVMHFRITTHGGTKASNTHPFPITDSVRRLQQLRSVSTVGVAHNGIIPISPRSGISDTMEYIATQLAPLSRALPDWYHSEPALELVKNALHSKLAVLTSDGEIITIGDFTEDGGVLYSNSSYLGYGKRWANSFYYPGWALDDYDDGAGTTKAASRKKSKKQKSKKSGGAIAIRQRPLMWLALADPGAYVSDPKTDHIIEGEDFLLDSDGHVYLYDATFDAAAKTDGYRAYTSNGTSLRYSEDLASPEYVILGD